MCYFTGFGLHNVDMCYFPWSSLHNVDMCYFTRSGLHNVDMCYFPGFGLHSVDMCYFPWSGLLYRYVSLSDLHSVESGLHSIQYYRRREHLYLFLVGNICGFEPLFQNNQSSLNCLETQCKFIGQ